MPSNSTPRRRGLNLSAKTLIGLALGIALGLFFGELVGWMQFAGDAFVGLLQMTVLPYISVSLVASLGRLTPRQAGRLGGRVGWVLLALWVLGLVAIMAAVWTFPPRESAAFYRHSLVELPDALNLLDLFIPTNPFRSLANNWIPAVVVFCVGLGLAAMNLPGKEPFLARLDDWLNVLKRLNGYVVSLTPYGVLAIAAATTGTMTLDDFARVQAYLLSYTLGVVVLAFFVLPAVITSCTPFRYRDVLDITLQAMITAFATAKLIVVLPQLIERTKELFDRYGHDHDEVRADVDVIYPLVYPIPNLGKILTLIFIPFVGWFLGTPLDAGDQPLLLGMGSVTYFGGPVIAMSFLLDAFRFPADMLQLFVVTGVYCARIGDVLSVMHLFAITVLGTCATQGLLRLHLPRLAARMAISVALAAVLMLGLRTWLANSVGVGPSKEVAVAQRQLLRHPSPAMVQTTAPAGGDSVCRRYAPGGHPPNARAARRLHERSLAVFLLQHPRRTRRSRCGHRAYVSRRAAVPVGIRPV